ncbi:MAG: hypothetical protein WCL02_06190 [bacterium]
MFFKHHDLNTIFWRLLGVSEDILEEYFQDKYTTISTVRNIKEAKKLPLSKKTAQALSKHIKKSTKTVDLDILLFVSFHDLSNQFTHYLYSHHIDTESIIEKYKKLNKNPMIIKM